MKKKAQDILKDYNRLMRCTTLIQAGTELGVTPKKARKLGVTIDRAILVIYTQEAARVMTTLEQQLYEICTSYYANRSNLRVNDQTGMYYKGSVHELLRYVDKYNLISYTEGLAHNETGFRESGVVFDLVNISVYADTGAIARVLEVAEVEAKMAYDQALKRVYANLQYASVPRPIGNRPSIV